MKTKTDSIDLIAKEIQEEDLELVVGGLPRRAWDCSDKPKCPDGSSPVGTLCLCLE